MRKFILIACSLLILVLTVRGQFIEYNHPQLQWQSFDTGHCTVHFHNGTKNTALIVGKIAEEIYPHITKLYNYEPDGKIHFVIKDTDDYSNGGAFFLDNKIEIWASNLDYIMRGTRNWLRDVVTHEFAHMVSIQNMIKSNLTFPYGFLQVFSYEKERRKDVVRGFPNGIVSYPLSSINIPIWFAEGTAQHQADGSRYDYRDPHREMILRDRILYDRMLTYNEMTVFGKSSHGNESVYNLGFSFIDYLTNRFGEQILEQITEASSKWNAYTFEGVLKDVIGLPADTLYAQWMDSLQNVYTERTASIRANPVKGSPVEKEGSANLYPVWSADGSKIAYVSNRGQDYFSINRLIIYDKQSKKKTAVANKISSSLSWSPDGRYIAYSRQERDSYGSAYNDLFLYDLQKEEEIRLTRYLRGSNPDFSHDGKKLVFVSATNGLHQMNIYHLPERFDVEFNKTLYFDIETGALTEQKDNDERLLRKVEFRGGKIEQVLQFTDTRQIYHPRWSPDDAQIIFDTAIEYGRNLAVYEIKEKSFDFFLKAEEELRYPFFDPGGDFLYYAASTTGIYNIYRYDLQSGAGELLTNVTGGAMMPSVNQAGELVYACYDSLGYHIYEISQPEALDRSQAEYDPNYIASIPDKNFDNTITENPEIRPYKQTFTPIHLLPRIMIDYGTVKPGLYLFSGDMLNKYLLLGGAAINSNLDYDLYGYFEVNEFKPSLFVEVFNMSANIDDKLEIERGEDYVLTYDMDVNFDLTEARVGANFNPWHFLNFEAALLWRNYKAKIHYNELYDPVKKRWEPPFTFHYTYLKGYALEWRIIADLITPGIDKAINPTAGRYIYFKHSYESSDFLDDFALQATRAEIFKNYSYNQFDLNWEEYFENPLMNDHAIGLHLRAGYIDRKVDGFFHLYGGGLLGMKGYSFFSMEGRHKLIGTLSYRFPLFKNIDALIGHVYFDKIFFGVFYQYGNTWGRSLEGQQYSNLSDNEKEVFDRIKDFDLMEFKRNIGLQLRLESFSFSLFPTRFFAEAVFPLDVAQNYDDSRDRLVTYPREWRYYFGALYEFDLRERMNNVMRASYLQKLARKLF